jgi:hypothetical protein
MTWSTVNTEVGRFVEYRYRFVNTGINTIPNDTLPAVARKEIPCPLCGELQGFGEIRREERNENGDVRHTTMPCDCGLYKTFWRELSKALPAHERQVRLRELRVSEKSQLPFHVQEKVIATLQASPDASYAFFGPAGTSKTTYTAALFREALWQQIKARWYQHQDRSSACNWERHPVDGIWRVSAKTLMDEFVAEATSKDALDGKPISPVVNRAKIVSATGSGYRPRLFLEEVDKVKYTEFKANALFEIIDAIYENEGQLVVNSNLPLARFAGLFDEEMGPAIIRRIGELCHNTVIDFFRAQ